MLYSDRIGRIATTRFTLGEVHEYLPLLARERRLPIEEILTAFATLPVEVYERADYAAKIREAERRIAQRDPDDVDLLALALVLGFPIWSNDRDFQGTGVIVYSTRDLLDRIKA